MTTSKTDRLKNRLAVIMVVAVTIVAGYAVCTPRVAAATGAPTVGNFAAGSVQCLGQWGSTPAVRFYGSPQTENETVLGVATDNRWEPLGEHMVTVWINNKEVSPIPETAVPEHLKPAMYFKLPAWDGVSAYNLAATVSNPRLSDEITFSLAWSGVPIFSLLATCWAKEAAGEITGNPPPS